MLGIFHAASAPLIILSYIRVFKGTLEVNNFDEYFILISPHYSGGDFKRLILRHTRHHLIQPELNRSIPARKTLLLWTSTAQKKLDFETGRIAVIRDGDLRAPWLEKALLTAGMLTDGEMR